jgi:hypothetical protein
VETLLHSRRRSDIDRGATCGGSNICRYEKDARQSGDGASARRGAVDCITEPAELTSPWIGLSGFDLSEGSIGGFKVEALGIEFPARPFTKALVLLVGGIYDRGEELCVA